MDLAFSKEEMAFREEVRSFFRDNVPPETRRKLVEGRHLSKDEMVTWWRILNKKGWGVSHWPKEYGGTGWTSVQHYIFNEELQMHPAPAPLAFGVSMVGPVIYTFGNETQKKQYLPRIANVDDWWCQGFSEPGSGSDLASLKTKAERKGDKYIINGQKTWTTLARHAGARGPGLSRKARRRRDRAQGARTDAASRRRRREQARQGQAQPGLLGAQDQGFGNPADHHRTLDGSDRPVRRAL